MWKLQMSDDERIPRLQRYMNGRLMHLYSMRPGKTARDRRNRERAQKVGEKTK